MLTSSVTMVRRSLRAPMLSSCGRSIAYSLDTMATSLLRIPRLRGPSHALCGHALPFSTTPTPLEKSLPPRRVLLDSDLIENFLKGSGPGGQKINKTSSAVQLKHIPTGIVVKYQDTRSRSLNRKMARRILQDRIEEATRGEDARTRVVARAKSKKKASSDKKKRRKYRALGESGGSEGEADGGETVEGESVEDVDESRAAQTEAARKPDGG
jgi:hypothetical protein